MLVEFTKMNGAGNDFVLIDNRDRKLSLLPEQIVGLCNRQKAIGADGLILLENSSNGKADFAWKFYNSDGSEAEMCGNGARCFARFIRQVTGRQDQIAFETISGIIHAEFVGHLVRVSLTTPTGLHLGMDLQWEGESRKVHFINTGVPHAVYFVDQLASVPVQKWGASLRYHAQFSPRGTNANFVQVLNDHSIRVRTYERGVEGETLACGTGVTAAALITARVFDYPSPVTVTTQGGDQLQVGFTWACENFKDVTLTGPAEVSFTGQIEI
ncbi:MAG TPA: diaminopimelate epimerase [Verrucomicrobiota bacterium]|jgi:diaminopimelate epimerase|nr:diaminopimelate epimerase [Verrucomicrobiota bacterium]